METFQAQQGKSVEGWVVQAVDQSQCSRGMLTQERKIRDTFSLWNDKYLEYPLVANLEDTCNLAGDHLAQQPAAPPTGQRGNQCLDGAEFQGGAYSLGLQSAQPYEVPESQCSSVSFGTCCKHL